MAATQYQTSENERIDLETAIDRTDHARLQEKLERIRDALAEVPDHYDATVTWQYTCTDTSAIRISSSHNFWNEGELGTTNIRIVVGPHGGLEKAQYEDEFSGHETDYTKGNTVRFAWKQITRRIEDAE